jgi:glycosyltransferase involved in cell wall biosynthesis
MRGSGTLMITNKPLVSIIIPVYNSERYLAEAIGSVLAQTYRPIEVIVVDDGSTDNTSEIVARDFCESVQYIYQDNSGPASARNTGLANAKGNIIAFIDADDFWSHDKLKIQLPLITSNPELEIVLGCLQYVRQSKSRKSNDKLEKISRPFVSLHFGASLIKKSAFEKIGLIDTTMNHFEDFDWFLHARDAGISIMTHKDVVLFYRLHDRNLSSNKYGSNSYFLKALKKSIDRRRYKTINLL